MINFESLKGKIDPLYLRQKIYEYLYEDSVHPTVKTSLKLLGARLLESYYHFTIIPSVYYYMKYTRHEAEPEFLATDNAIDALMAKGHNRYEVIEFMHKVSGGS